MYGGAEMQTRVQEVNAWRNARDVAFGPGLYF